VSVPLEAFFSCFMLINVVCFSMVELKEKMAHKEDEANITVKELSEKLKMIDTEIIEEKVKR